jgi:hypothetical protein
MRSMVEGARRLLDPLHPRRAGAFGEVANPADIGLALGDRDHAASLEGLNMWLASTACS